MKVLYLCSDASIDLTGQKGASIHIRSLVRALADAGHEVTVLCTQVTSPTSIEGELHANVRPVTLTGWNQGLARAVRARNRFLRKPTRKFPDAALALHNLRFFRAAAGAARERYTRILYR